MSEYTEHGFRLGAIEVTALAKFPTGSVVLVRVGGTEIDVTATPKGRRVYVTVKDDGRSRVLLSAHIDGRWWQPGAAGHGCDCGEFHGRQPGGQS